MPAPRNSWIARQRIICSIVEANPHRKLAIVKPEAEIANSNLVPSARDRNPDSGIAITSAIRYEVWTHDTSLELAEHHDEERNQPSRRDALGRRSGGVHHHRRGGGVSHDLLGSERVLKSGA